jgi:hypothetical protein
MFPRLSRLGFAKNSTPHPGKRRPSVRYRPPFDDLEERSQPSAAKVMGSPNPVKPGQLTALTAKVADAPGSVIDSTATFTIGSTVLGSLHAEDLNPAPTVMVTFSVPLRVGTHMIVASFTPAAGNPGETASQGQTTEVIQASGNNSTAFPGDVTAHVWIKRLLPCQHPGHRMRQQLQVCTSAPQMLTGPLYLVFYGLNPGTHVEHAGGVMQKMPSLNSAIVPLRVSQIKMHKCINVTFIFEDPQNLPISLLSTLVRRPGHSLRYWSTRRQDP